MTVTESIPLDSEHLVADPRLDAVYVHDSRSDNYLASEVLPVAEYPKFWTMGTVFDQGQEGDCVGFGWTAELVGSPYPDYSVSEPLGDLVGHNLCQRAKSLDDTPGTDYQGTSLLAGAKVVQQQQLIDGYRWCTSTTDMRNAICASVADGGGPVLVAIPWYDEMYETRPSGLVKVGGSLVGRHCLTLFGFHPGMRISGEDWSSRYRVFAWRNSWGTSYGKAGSGYILESDLAALFADHGQAAIPMGRRKVRLAGSPLDGPRL